MGETRAAKLVVCRKASTWTAEAVKRWLGAKDKAEAEVGQKGILFIFKCHCCVAAGAGACLT